MNSTLTDLDRIHRDLMALAREAKDRALQNRILEILVRVRMPYRQAAQ